MDMRTKNELYQFFLLVSEKRIVAVQPDVSEVQVVVVTIEWFKILFKNPKK